MPARALGTEQSKNLWTKAKWTFDPFGDHPNQCWPIGQTVQGSVDFRKRACEVNRIRTIAG